MTIEDSLDAVDRLSRLFAAQFWTDDIRDAWADRLSDVDPVALHAAVDDLAVNVERVTLSQVFGCAAAHKVALRGDPMRDLSDCPNRCEYGWVESDEGLRPCFIHRSEQHERWADGKYASDFRRQSDPAGRPMPEAVRELRAQLAELPRSKRGRAA